MGNKLGYNEQFAVDFPMIIQSSIKLTKLNKALSQDAGRIEKLYGKVSNHIDKAKKIIPYCIHILQKNEVKIFFIEK